MHYNKAMKIFLSVVGVVAVGLLATFGFYTQNSYIDSRIDSKISAIPKQEVSVGSTLPIAGQTYNLAGSGISSSASSITLTSLTIKQTGQPIQDSDVGDTFYMTIEPGSNTKQEIIGCTTIGSNTGGSVTISGCSRGLSPITPYTASTTLAFTHAGGSQVIFSDPPQLFNQYYALGNMGSSTNILSFSPLTPPQYYPSVGSQATGGINSTSSEFASIAFVQQTALSGTVNATTLAKGIIQLATARQAASSTGNGTTGAADVLQSSYATDTPQNCSTPANGGCVILSDLGGHIKQAWLDLTQAFTVSGAWTFNSSATFTAAVSIIANVANKLTLNGQAYSFPGAAAASSTALQNDGNNNLFWGPAHSQYTGYNVAGTSISTSAYATTSLITIPANMMNGSSTIEVGGSWSCGYVSGSGGTCNMYIRDQSGNTLATLALGSRSSSGNGADPTGPFTVRIFPRNSASLQQSIYCIASLGILTTGSANLVGNSQCGDAGTSAINLNNATTINVVLKTTSDTAASDAGLYVIVNQ